MSNSFNLTPTLDGLVNITADSITTDSIQTNTINVTDEITTNKLTATGDITQTGGILSIVSFPNVGNTLSDYGQRLTGITYNGVTDETTIDNNLIISNQITAVDTTVEHQFSDIRCQNANVDVNLSVTGIFSQPANGGIISQLGTGTNSMKAITMNSNTDLTQSGTGKINQSSSTGVNTMGAITMNSNTNLTQSGTGIISQTGSGTNQFKSTNITGTLSIPNYPNVESTLTSLSNTTANLDGITYNAGTDTTTIDNNVYITKALDLLGNITSTSTTNKIQATTTTFGSLALTTTLGIRDLNIVGGAGGIRCCRADPANAGFIELINCDVTGTATNNIITLAGGTSSDNRFRILFRTPTDLETFAVRRTQSNFYTPLDVAGNITQSSTNIISQTGTGTNTLKGTTFTGDIVNNTTTASISLATSYYGCKGDTTSNYIGVGAGAAAPALFRYNVCLGNGAGNLLNGGDQNTFVGYFAGNKNVSATSNTGIGYGALQNTTGQNNTAVGRNAMVSNTSGTANVAVGNGSGSSINATATNNVCVGFAAGGAINGNNNTAIGYNSWNSGSATYSNSTAIGTNAIPTASNQIMLGTASESVQIPNTITFQDGSIMRAYDNRPVSDIDIHNYVVGNKTILTSTFSVGESNASMYSAVTANVTRFTPIKLYKGQVINGVGFFPGNTGNFYVGLYNKGASAARLAVSNVYSSAGNVNKMNYVDFITAYTIPTTDIYYLALLQTSSSQNILSTGVSTYIQWQENTLTNGTLNKRQQAITGLATLPNPIAAGQVFTLENVVFYLVVY
jgi:hypothetical protein